MTHSEMSSFGSGKEGTSNKRNSGSPQRNNVSNLEQAGKEKYAHIEDIPLSTLLPQYENLKQYEAIIHRDIRGETQEVSAANIARGRELLAVIKKELQVKTASPVDIVTGVKKKLQAYLSSVGLASDDGQ